MTADFIAGGAALVVYAVILYVIWRLDRRHHSVPEVTVTITANTDQFRKAVAETHVDVLQEMCREIAARGPLS